MLPLAEKLLNAAQFYYDQSDHTWVVPARLLPVVTVECGEDKERIEGALVEVSVVLEAGGCKCSHFSVSGSHVSIVGLTKAGIAAGGTLDP